MIKCKRSAYNSINSAVLLILSSLLLVSACKSKKEEQKTDDTNYLSYTVQSSLPHDVKAFTQGFTIHKGQLYESTGQSTSWIGVVDIKTGVAERKVELPDQFFGEGITILNNKIYQLTWQNNIGFVYDLTTFKKLKEFNYSTEGWGLTHNNQQLIMSDGTDKLHFLDTLTLSITKSLNVRYKEKPVTALNELEYVDGFIYANVWQTNLLAKIDASTGNVEGFLDLAPLTKQTGMINPNQDVLNGIAWHEGTQSLLVTGKYWPLIYVLKINK